MRFEKQTRPHRYCDDHVVWLVSNWLLPDKPMGKSAQSVLWFKINGISIFVSSRLWNVVVCLDGIGRAYPESHWLPMENVPVESTRFGFGCVCSVSTIAGQHSICSVCRKFSILYIESSISNRSGWSIPSAPRWRLAWVRVYTRWIFWIVAVDWLC